jgi:hypothetical protein
MERAENLEQVPRFVDRNPLRQGDPRWIDLAKGSGSTDPNKLRTYLRDNRDPPNGEFATCLFTGHRGCGKTTELFRVVHDVRDAFTCLVVQPDDSLLGDLDFSDLFLWLFESLLSHLQDQEISLGEEVLKPFRSWFKEVDLEIADEIKEENEKEKEASIGGGYWILKYLVRFKSIWKGNKTTRETIREKMQKYSTELIDLLNDVLDDAAEKLQEAGKHRNLLIAVDKLDELSPEVARRLFHDHGDLLKQLHAHIIYTVPIATVLAVNTGKIFDHKFILPMVAVRNRNGNKAKKGADVLVELLRQRMDLERLFSHKHLPGLLVEMSGGSPRDLIILVLEARLSALAMGRETIDRHCVDEAVNKMSNEFKRMLVPSQTYYPILARIHHDKTDWFANGEEASPIDAENHRQFFSKLLSDGVVMEYNGGQSWYDVHPCVQKIDLFEKAWNHVQSEEPPQASI